MEQNLDLRKQAWERFVHDDILEDWVNPVIAASWKRCKAQGLNFHDGKGSRIEYLFPVQLCRGSLPALRPLPWRRCLKASVSSGVG